MLLAMLQTDDDFWCVNFKPCCQPAYCINLTHTMLLVNVCLVDDWCYISTYAMLPMCFCLVCCWMIMMFVCCWNCWSNACCYVLLFLKLELPWISHFCLFWHVVCGSHCHAIWISHVDNELWSWTYHAIMRCLLNVGLLMLHDEHLLLNACCCFSKTLRLHRSIEHD